MSCASKVFCLAKANVPGHAGQATRTARLQVEVLAEGPRSVIERLDVSGNKKNSTEAVLEYLDSEAGNGASSKLDRQDPRSAVGRGSVPDQQRQSWPPDAQGRVTLRIELVEDNEAPPLGQEFSRTEQAMLKLRDWLANADQRGDELVVRNAGSPGAFPAVEAVLSPRRGLLALAAAAEGTGS